VIGSGHGVLHPRAHARLAQAIVESGGAVVSELAPTVPPSRGTFPRRNRLISGLADATVVVEAPARSGALITASWALEQGRPCFIVPGAIDDPASAGCLAFLREFTETRVVAGIPQLIDDLGLADQIAEGRVPSEVAATLADVGPAAARLGRELVLGRATVDELVAATGWPVASVLVGLTLLERQGLAVGIHGRFRPAGNLVLADPRQRRQRPRRTPAGSARFAPADPSVVP
jgi:DNA processing protein